MKFNLCPDPSNKLIGKLFHPNDYHSWYSLFNNRHFEYSPKDVFIYLGYNSVDYGYNSVDDEDDDRYYIFLSFRTTEFVHFFSDQIKFNTFKEIRNKK